jgi:hypothetical protein
MLMMYSLSKFHAPVSNVSLAIIIKQPSCCLEMYERISRRTLYVFGMSVTVHRLKTAFFIPDCQ